MGYVIIRHNSLSLDLKYEPIKYRVVNWGLVTMRHSSLSLDMKYI